MCADSDKRLEAIRKEIDDAFGDLSYPGDEQIMKPGKQDYEETMALLAGKHWKDIAPSDLLYNDEYIAYVGPSAFQFFLPAWLLAMIQEDVNTDVLPENMVSRLTVPESNDSFLGIWREHVSALSGRQWRVVGQALEYMAEGHPYNDPDFIGDVKTALASLRQAGYLE